MKKSTSHSKRKEIIFNTVQKPRKNRDKRNLFNHHHRRQWICASYLNKINSYLDGLSEAEPPLCLCRTCCFGRIQRLNATLKKGKLWINYFKQNAYKNIRECSSPISTNEFEDLVSLSDFFSEDEFSNDAFSSSDEDEEDIPVITPAQEREVVDLTADRVVIDLTSDDEGKPSK
jgi:hypothetical protein